MYHAMTQLSLNTESNDIMQFWNSGYFIKVPDFLFIFGALRRDVIVDQLWWASCGLIADQLSNDDLFAQFCLIS